MLSKCMLIAGLGLKQTNAYKNVYGDLALLQANQVDCDEGLLKGQKSCEGEQCGLWMCELIGKAPVQQKICTGFCAATNQPTGRKICSCMQKLGFIMVQGECSWQMVEEPQCPAEGITLNDSVDSALSDETNSDETESNLSETEPKRQEELKPLTLETVPKNEPQCPIDFPMEDEWYCDSAELVHDTRCKMRCHPQEKYHRNKCVCKGGKCFWRKAWERCDEEVPEEPEEPEERPQMLNDFSAFANLQSSFESQEETIEEQVEEVFPSRTREQNDEDDNDKFNGLLDLMKMMIDKSHNLFNSMMNVLSDFA